MTMNPKKTAKARPSAKTHGSAKSQSTAKKQALAKKQGSAKELVATTPLAPRPWLLGITGASGAIYAARFLQHMTRLGHAVDVVISDAGQEVLAYEEQLDCLELAHRIFDKNDWFAPPASGSAKYQGMVILPCSMGTLAKVATGISDTLLTRAADVSLKEKRTLILVPREMPFNAIHLENLQRVERAGGLILPACPHFYRHPKSIDDLVDTVIAKVLDQLKIEHDLARPWGES